MDTKAISEALHKQPFQPFVIRLADGRAIHVPHPDFVAVSKRLAIFINPDDESVTWIEPLLIITIEYSTSAPKAAPGTNGGK